MIIGTSAVFSKFSEIKFFMSSKPGGISPAPYYLNMSFSVNDKETNVHQNRQLFFNAVKINKDDIAFPRQIHSETVNVVDEPGIYPDCDALTTNKKEVFLAISVADCVPIFLYDPVNQAIGAVHSGWQGSSKKILLRTLETMSKEYGSDGFNLYAHIGYSAGGCCYEVGSDVASLFDPNFSTQKPNGKYLLDLKKFNYSLLLSYGLPANQIEVSEFCTICNPNFLHSYRRDGINSGRMMGLIGMTK